MTKDELQELLRQLGLDYSAEANQIYVFYVHPDGRVDNFSVSVRRGTSMSDGEIRGRMRREYPASRDGAVLGVERPEGISHPEAAPRDWVEVSEACRLLGISRKTIRRWTQRGVFASSRIGGRLYYDRADIDRAIADNLVQENGRLDTKGWKDKEGQ